VSVPVPELRSLAQELLGGVDVLFKKGCDRAALILLYASIDILGAATTAGGEATRDSFLAWVDTYMAPSGSLGCSSLEVYSARCGMLHALSSESRLTAGGAAREFAYVGGGVDPSAVEGTKKGRPVVVLHFGDLWASFHSAVEKFVGDIETDAATAARVRNNLTKVYALKAR
jgi:hypothetical protein